MTGDNPPPFDIDPEFIEQSRRVKLGRSSHSGPYTRAQRRKRRAEVYRLHFELGLPAIKIAGMMRVDRNTVNSDLKVLYAQAAEEYQENTWGDYIEKQFTRLELQRARILSYLSETNDVDKKIAVERLVADIDFKVMTGLLKLQARPYANEEEVIKRLNEAAAKQGLKYKFTSIFEMLAISDGSRKRLDALKSEVWLYR